MILREKVLLYRWLSRQKYDAKIIEGRKKELEKKEEIILPKDTPHEC